MYIFCEIPYYNLLDDDVDDDYDDALARALPGYLVPRLVREVPGEEAKVVLAAGLDTA